MSLVPSVNTRFVAPGQSPVPNLLGYVPGLVPIYNDLKAALNAVPGGAGEIWCTPGITKQDKTSDNKLVERNICDLRRPFIADNTSIAYVTDPFTSGGARRWEFTNQAEEGFRGSIRSALSTFADGFTIFIPDMEQTVAANTAMFGAGNVSASRTSWYLNAAGRQTFSNGTGGTGNLSVTGLTVSGLNIRRGVHLSFRTADKTIQMYTDEAADASVTGTVMAQGANATTLIGLFGTYDDAVDGACRAGGAFLINKPIHDPAWATLRDGVFNFTAAYRAYAV